MPLFANVVSIATPVTSPHQRSKSVLWVDAFVSLSDPTMRQLLQALPALEAAGWEIRVWCLRSDLPREKVRHVVFPAPRWLGPLALIYFSIIANLFVLWRWLTRAPRPATIIHATCGTHLGADIISVHFLNGVWMRRQLALGFAHWKEAAQFFLHGIGAIFERMAWRSPALRMVLPVSDSVGEEVRSHTRPAVEVVTLPNSYDALRFNAAVREAERPVFRAKLGFAEGDRVFAFASLGHHKRKGFWLVVEALARLRTDPQMRCAKFLVIGGTTGTLAALQEQLAARAPDWRQWLTFTGHQACVEKYLSAADAFLYPSYFEAFCLAEIEAAALGIPLLLTRHHGSEMILEEGVNGLWLEFDPAAIAATLRRFISMKPGTFRRSVGRALDRTQYSERLLSIYERFLTQTRAATHDNAD